MPGRHWKYRQWKKTKPPTLEEWIWGYNQSHQDFGTELGLGLRIRVWVRGRIRDRVRIRISGIRFNVRVRVRVRVRRLGLEG